MKNSREFKIKLIFPCKFEVFDPYGVSIGYCLPYGMGVLAGFLRQHGYYLEQEDLSAKFNQDALLFPVLQIGRGRDLGVLKNKVGIAAFLKTGEIKGRLGKIIDNISNSCDVGKFRLIGLSIFSYSNFLFALMFSARIRQRFNVPIVFGGPFINYYGHLYPEIFNFADFMIRGDGSVPLLKLVHHLEGRTHVHEVPNLSYKNNGNIEVNPSQNYSLEDMSIPDLNGIPLRPYDDYYSLSFLRRDVLLPYQVTRNCSNSCSFCVRKHVDSRLEFKSYDKVVSELRIMKGRYKSHNFIFTDDAINNSYEYLEGFCDRLVNEKLGIGWYSNAKVGNLDEKILRKMKGAGCRMLFFGVESGSDKILKKMNKGFTAEKADKVIMWTHQSGIKISVYFIAGYLGETRDDIHRTLGFIKKNKSRLHVMSIAPYTLTYGSDVYFDPEVHGVTNLSPTFLRFIFSFDESCGLKWEQKQKQQAHSRQQMIKAARTFHYFPHNFRLFLAICLRSVIARIHRKRVFRKRIMPRSSIE
jgi:hypothetical protein